MADLNDGEINATREKDFASMRVLGIPRNLAREAMSESNNQLAMAVDWALEVIEKKKKSSRDEQGHPLYQPLERWSGGREFANAGTNSIFSGRSF